MNIKRPESKLSKALNYYRRMQNRESAVRSRMRKKYHQDDLEGRIEELEMMHKEVS